VHVPYSEILSKKKKRYLEWASGMMVKMARFHMVDYIQVWTWWFEKQAGHMCVCVQNTERIEEKKIVVWPPF